MLTGAQNFRSDAVRTGLRADRDWRQIGGTARVTAWLSGYSA